LTSDVDPQTACYVRFYHEKFQKNKPELLHQIKRATKTDQQSKDDVESLKLEVAKLKETLCATTADYDRKIAELSYECNRRITAMNADYDKLTTLVHHVLAGNGGQTASVAAGGLCELPAAQAPPPAPVVPNLLHSLSQIATVNLQNHLRPSQPLAGPQNGKRLAEQEGANAPPSSYPRNS
jgi:hypothetical protein